jgi:O-antigen ligase
MISRVYYGLSLSNILIYSNSWFSYSGKSPDLRMFSIMPDSHSFAMIAVFLIAYLLPLTYFYNKKELFRRESMPMLPNKINYFVWSAVRFSGLAVILSGTRGVWVGLLAPFFLTIVFYAKKISRPIVIKIFWAMAMIILLFMLSPLINMGLQTIRFSKYEENFLKRAASIYDLGEESNTNRILIWEQSLKYFAHHPQGVGAGNFVVTLLPDSAKNLPFKDIANLKNYRYNLPQKFVTAHSLYLNILVELGVLGALAFAFLIASYLWAVWSFIKQFGSESNLYTFFVINTAFTFVAFLAYGVFDVTLFNDKIMMYTLISLAISGVIITRYKEFKE